MKYSRQLPTQPRRDAWVEINLGALEANARLLRQAVDPSQDLMAVVKADAYGHGAVMAIPSLQAAGIQQVGVASIDEAFQIRNAGLEMPILVLGDSPDWSVQLAVESDVTLTVFSNSHLETLKAQYEVTGIPAKVHIKVDTGMHRIGVPWGEAVTFVESCQQAPYLVVDGLFTHFAAADDVEKNRQQLDRWTQVLQGLSKRPPRLHVCNSSGIFHVPPEYEKTLAQWSNTVRLGIALFGYGAPEVVQRLGLQPTMGLRARIVHIQDIDAGVGVSYDYAFVTSRPSRIATMPCGYADGISRRLSGQMKALLHGQKIPQVGRITMDQMMVDVTDVPQAKVGDAVTLLGGFDGEALTLSQWAQVLGTIEYELMCGLRVRLPRTYTRD